jgi:hypothetical protein
MSSKQPKSFLLFVLCISLQLAAFSGLYAYFKFNPGVSLVAVGIYAVSIWVLVWVLAGIGLVYGFRYKTEEKSARVYNRVGITGNILHYLVTIGLLLLALSSD